MAGYPLRDEPSVPCLDDYDHSFRGGRSPIRETPEDEKFIFRNSIYSPLGSSSDRNAASGGMDIRHNSTASEGGGRSYGRGTSIKDVSHQDLADHFMYQVPSSLNSQNSVDQLETSFDKPVKTPSGGLEEEQEELYQNTTDAAMNNQNNSVESGVVNASEELYQNPTAIPAAVN